MTFPFLFGGAFIEAPNFMSPEKIFPDFPSFSEGLSLRLSDRGTLITSA